MKDIDMPIDWECEAGLGKLPSPQVQSVLEHFPGLHNLQVMEEDPPV
jgi:hypothetical protein